MVYLPDTSAWSRLGLAPVAERIAAAVIGPGVVMAPTVVLELGFSARNLREWDGTWGDLAAFDVVDMTAETFRIAAGLQRALWAGGRVRAAGVADTLVAALAIQHDATVLHYDADFTHLAAVDHRLREEWVVPRGSV